MAEYIPKPAQFRLPAWAHEFLAQESAATGATKTDVVLEALSALKRARTEQSLIAGYQECGEWIAREATEWDATLADGLEDERW